MNTELCNLCDSWLDGLLEPAEETAFQLHLQQCRQCAGRVQKWEMLKLDVEAACRLLGSSSDEPLISPALWKEKFDQPKPSAGGKWLSLSLCVVLLLGIGAGIWLVMFFRANSPANGRAEAKSSTRVESGIIPESNPRANLVSIEVKAPVIAAPSLTSSKFTVVQVYPVFKERD